jgi:hypothetical protein
LVADGFVHDLGAGDGTRRDPACRGRHLVNPLSDPFKHQRFTEWRKAAKLLNAEIKIASQIGQGSVFSVVLPDVAGQSGN